MRIKYFFQPSRWRSFGIYLLRRFLKKVDGSEWTPEVHEIEQYMYRYLSCSDCMIHRKCIHSDCGCKMPERAHVRTDICPTKKWGPFMDAYRWGKYKRENKIQFTYFKKIEDV